MEPPPLGHPMVMLHTSRRYTPRPAVTSDTPVPDTFTTPPGPSTREKQGGARPAQGPDPDSDREKWALEPGSSRSSSSYAEFRSPTMAGRGMWLLAPVLNS